jgi:hypothetical protein
MLTNPIVLLSYFSRGKCLPSGKVIGVPYGVVKTLTNLSEGICNSLQIKKLSAGLPLGCRYLLQSPTGQGAREGIAF